MSGRRRAGLTLIEVLVAMAVLVIGIMAVLRIFPKSLGLVSTTRDKADAVRVGQSLLTRLQSVESQLPEAILPAGLPTDTNTASASFGFLRMSPNSDLNRPFDFNNVSGWTDPSDSTSLYRQLAADRLVVGERAIVPRGLPAVTGASQQPTATLFGPIATDSGTGAPSVAAFRLYRAIDAGDLRVTQSAGAYQGRAVFTLVTGGSDPFTGLPSNARLWFELDSSPRTFVIRYAWSNNGVATWAQVPGSVATLPAATASPATQYQVLDLPTPYVIPGSVQVRQVLDPSGAGRFGYDTSLASLGFLRLPQALAGETVSLEYVVDDWRWLSETVSLTIGAGGAIQNTPPNGPVVNNSLALLTSDLDNTVTPLLVLAGTGQQLAAVDTTRWGGDPTQARSGHIPLDPAFTATSLAAGSYETKVYYRRANNWAVVPSLAPASYILAEDAVSLAGTVANYSVPNHVVEARQTTVGGGDYLDLLFRPSEAGRSVVVDYQYKDPTSGLQQVSGELHVVPIVSNATSTVVAGAARHYVRLRHPLGAGATAFDSRAWVHAVAGVSLRVRVVYNDENMVRSGVSVAPAPLGTVSGSDSRQRLYELSWLVRRHR